MEDISGPKVPAKGFPGRSPWEHMGMWVLRSVSRSSLVLLFTF